MSNPFGKNGAFTKIGEHIPGVNNGIQELHRRAGNNDALARARRSDPIGANGAITKGAEYIPGVNNVVQGLHQRAGKTDAQTRAAKVNPTGANGAVTKVFEHVPVASSVVQALHKNAGKDLECERARRANPIGADGIITKGAEYVPIVNFAVQELHRQGGEQEALERAREHNPIGAHGYITKTAEMVPVLNDGVGAMHRLMGQKASAERVEGRTLQAMLSKDGAITKIAELVPVSNLVCFALHEAHGNHAEAARSLHLLKNWKNVGSPNGPLAKVAEMLPLTDVIAFTAHLNAGNYAQAIRAVTKAKTVKVSIKQFTVQMSCPTVREFRATATEVVAVDILPTAPSLMGGLMDVGMEVMDVDISRVPRRGSKREKTSYSSSSYEDGSFSRNKPILEQRLTELIQEIVRDTQRRMPEILGEALVMANHNFRTVRGKHLAARLLLPEELPPLNDEIIQAVRQALPRVTLTHASAEPAAPIKRRGRKEGNFPEAASAVSCFSCAGCIGFGCHTGALACLAGAVAGLSWLSRWVSRSAVPSLNAFNSGEWRSAAPPPVEGDNKSAAAVSSLNDAHGDNRSAEGMRSAGVSNGEDKRSIPAIIVSPCIEDTESLSDLVHAYLLEEMMGGSLAGWFVRQFEGELRDSLSGLVEPAGAVVPFTLNVVVPEQVVPNKFVDVKLPRFCLPLFLDLSLSGRGPYITGVRVAIPDEIVQQLVDTVQAQVSALDLRKLDKRAKGFKDPVHAKFDTSITWSKPCDPKIEVRNLSCNINLPM